MLSREGVENDLRAFELLARYASDPDNGFCMEDRDLWHDKAAAARSILKEFDDLQELHMSDAFGFVIAQAARQRAVESARLVRRLEQAGCRLLIKEGRLEVGPSRLIPADLIEEIRDRKDELVQIIQ